MEKVLMKNDLGIFALGGLGEVGKNMYCIEYLNQIFIIDSGILTKKEICMLKVIDRTANETKIDNLIVELDKQLTK